MEAATFLPRSHMKSRRGPRQLIPGDDRILCDPMFAHLPLAQVKSPGLGNGSDLFSYFGRPGYGTAWWPEVAGFLGEGPGFLPSLGSKKRAPRLHYPCPSESSHQSTARVKKGSLTRPLNFVYVGIVLSDHAGNTVFLTSQLWGRRGTAHGSSQQQPSTMPGLQRA